MAMTHTQALSKLAADTLVQTLEEDVARVMARTFALGRHDAAIAANYGGHAPQPCTYSAWKRPSSSMATTSAAR